MRTESRINFIAFFLSLTFVFCFSDANGTEIRWIAGKTLGADWNTPTNWDLGRVPIESDSVIAGYGDWVNITSGYTATCVYLKILSRLNISVGGKLWIKDGQFDALGEINNYGSIKVTNSPEEGMIFATQGSDVIFENHGEIYIDQSVKEGIFIKFDQVFNNNGSGFIEIINAGLESFKVEGVFNNSGVLNVGSSAIGIALSINMSPSVSTARSEINNLLCGKMVILDQFAISDGIFENDGFFRQNYNGENDLSALEADVNNNGVVEDIKGSFDDSDFDAQTIWLRPVINLEVNTGEPTIPMVNSLPPSHTFSDIFTDNLLTQNAGMYDAITNTWIPNANADGFSTFFMEIAQSEGICKDTVRFDLETPVIETIYWKGGFGSWQSAIKWSTGNVPTASDLVGIYGLTDDVFIPINTDAFAKTVALSGKLTINITASLDVSSSGSLRGIYVQKGTLINKGVLNVSDCTIGIDLLNASMTNIQSINCTSTTTCIEIDQNAGLFSSLANSGAITNTAGDLINGDDAEVYNTGSLVGNLPIYACVFSDNLRNEGSITIEGDGVNGRGVFGTIVNAVNGTIFAEKLDIGLEIEGNNSGIIQAEFCDTGIEISDNFINFQGAELKVKHSNTGVLVNDGNFENRAGALMSIKRNGNYGLRISKPFISAGYLFNAGLIEIDTTAGIGILNSNDITNQSSGVINVRNSSSHGFHSLSQYAVLVNKNQGLINIIKSGGIGLNHEGGTINNENSGQIIIDRSVLEDIHIRDFIDEPFIYNSSFVNQAQILIK